MRTLCKRIGITDGRPFCVHGPMQKQGFTPYGKQQWRCAITNERNRIQVNVAGKNYSFSVAPERKAEVQKKIRAFRDSQRKNYSEVNKVWLDQLDSHAK